MTVERRLRLSQTVAPFGVGAIFDVLGESFVAAEPRLWGGQGETLRLERLERQLGVSALKSAPTVGGRGATNVRGLPFTRFPTALFCARCRRVVSWRKDFERPGEPATCPHCGGRRPPRLVPMRFVAVCPEGHLTDVPWKEWAHSRGSTPDQKQCHSPELELVSRDRSGTGGLDALVIKCRRCGAGRSLNGISAKDSLQPLRARTPDAVMCGGTQPWQRTDQGEPCGELLQIVQRGASNVYFANVESALDIPPGSDFDPYADLALEIQNHPNFRAIESAPNGPISGVLAAGIANDVGCTVNEVFAVVQGVSTAAPAVDTVDEDLRTGEWRAFTAPPREYHPKAHFIRETAAPDVPESSGRAGAELAALMGRVELAIRLREVRALESFCRHTPNGRRVPVDPGLSLGWLPAVEVFGEGVFISFDEGRVAAWEQDVQDVGARLETRRLENLFGERLPPATPRFVMLHTFAHLLVRQLVFECGYAAASLSERIYSATPEQAVEGGEPQAGVLIYTAAGDVEGTMGGLVGQGRPPRLGASILKALERGAWCSSDPLCSENPGQGFGSLNLAACHSCCLLPETSCETGNRLLDRSLVVGNPAKGVRGFFEEVVTATLGEATRVLRGVT